LLTNQKKKERSKHNIFLAVGGWRGGGREKSYKRKKTNPITTQCGGGRSRGVGLKGCVPRKEPTQTTLPPEGRMVQGWKKKKKKKKQKKQEKEKKKEIQRKKRKKKKKTKTWGGGKETKKKNPPPIPPPKY